MLLKHLQQEGRVMKKISSASLWMSLRVLFLLIGSAWGQIALSEAKAYIGKRATQAGLNNRKTFSAITLTKGIWFFLILGTLFGCSQLQRQQTSQTNPEKQQEKQQQEQQEKTGMPTFTYRPGG